MPGVDNARMIETVVYEFQGSVEKFSESLKDLYAPTPRSQYSGDCDLPQTPREANDTMILRISVMIHHVRKSSILRPVPFSLKVPI